MVTTRDRCQLAFTTHGETTQLAKKRGKTALTVFFCTIFYVRLNRKLRSKFRAKYEYFCPLGALLCYWLDTALLCGHRITSAVLLAHRREKSYRKFKRFIEEASELIVSLQLF